MFFFKGEFWTDDKVEKLRGTSQFSKTVKEAFDRYEWAVQKSDRLDKLAHYHRPEEFGMGGVELEEQALYFEYCDEADEASQQVKDHGCRLFFELQRSVFRKEDDEALKQGKGLTSDQNAILNLDFEGWLRRELWLNLRHNLDQELYDMSTNNLPFDDEQQQRKDWLEATRAERVLLINLVLRNDHIGVGQSFDLIALLEEYRRLHDEFVFNECNADFDCVLERERMRKDLFLKMYRL